MKGTVSQDYDHILICAPAKPAPREVIRQVKQRSSMKLFSGEFN